MRPAWRNAAIALFALALLFGGMMGDRLLALTGEGRDALRLYTELVGTAHDTYGSEIEYGAIVRASVEGMLRTLDPHTNYLPPRAYDDMRERQQETFYGLGIYVSLRNSRLTVIAPMEGTPASRLGMRAGDVISHIEGESTSGMSVDEAVGRLKGPKGTPVNITIVRAGLDEPLDLEIVRDEIPQTTVRYAYMLEPGTGFVSLSDFSRSSSREIQEAIADLRTQGMERLVLDLRYNGGGLLDQAIEVADQFLPAGAPIVETRGRTRDSLQEYQAAGDQAYLDLPLVVLVNGGSASASEILAGAIQDHDVGLIVGTPTWGKGLVQTVYSLPYGAGLALTTAKYYTPSGRLIQRDYTSWFDYQAHEQNDGETSDLGPEFLTDLGRTVYGGGGITPDFEVEPLEIDPFLQYLHSRNAFFRFATEWANTHDAVEEEWEPEQEVYGEFVGWARENELIGDDEGEAEQLDNADNREYALRQIQAEVLSAAYGLGARHRVLIRGDQQVIRALELFHEAGELLLARDRMERDGERDPMPSLSAGLQ